MSNCGIGDSASSLFCRILSRRVEMTRDEIVEWRKNRIELIIASDSQLQIPQISQKQKRPGSEHSQTGGKSDSRKEIVWQKTQWPWRRFLVLTDCFSYREFRLRGNPSRPPYKRTGEKQDGLIVEVFLGPTIIFGPKNCTSTNKNLVDGRPQIIAGKID